MGGEQRRQLGQRTMVRVVAQGLAGMVAHGGTEGLRTAADAAALARAAEAEVIASDASVSILVYRAWGRKPNPAAA